MKYAALLGCALILSCACGAWAANLVFTYDGVEYTLGDDGSWSCKGKTCPAADAEDFTITLSDGREVVLASGSQWHFREKGELVGTGDIKVSDVSVTFVGHSSRVDYAEQQATPGVLKKVAEKIVAGAPKRKVTQAKVLYCMNYLHVIPDIQRAKDKAGAWDATATVKLNRRQILDIIDCAQQVVDTRQPGDTSTAKHQH